MKRLALWILLASLPASGFAGAELIQPNVVRAYGTGNRVAVSTIMYEACGGLFTIVGKDKLEDEVIDYSFECTVAPSVIDSEPEEYLVVTAK